MITEKNQDLLAWPSIQDSDNVGYEIVDISEKINNE